jgi:DNA-directed RNA polymerase specialized sigma subunit
MESLAPAPVNWYGDREITRSSRDTMKIPLNLGQNGNQSTVAAQAKVMERDVLAAKGGDWNARNNLARTFSPLIQSLARKRASDAATINRLTDAGKEGLYTAAKKYRSSIGADRFQVFALEFIERAMDDQLKGGNWFSRLFRR